MPAHRARGIGFIIRSILSMRARTIRVVFAAKLLEKLVLHALSLLSLLSIKAFRYLCPLSVHLQEPVSTSHRRTVLSLLPDAMTVPSAEKDTELT